MKLCSATATISTELFIVLRVTSNCTNTISNMEKDCQEISLQSKELHDSLKLRKIVVLSKECMSLKTRGLEKNLTQKKVVPDLFSVIN